MFEHDTILIPKETSWFGYYPDWSFKTILPPQETIVAECVQNFITSMDSLKLNMVAVDQVYPLLSDLSASLNKLSILPADFQGKTKMKEWLLRLSKMGAADELTEQQSRQLNFDYESSSYNSFMAALHKAGN